MSENTYFELSYNGEGVSITEYDTSNPDHWTVNEEWWFTWTELFNELTGRNAAPNVV